MRRVERIAFDMDGTLIGYERSLDDPGGFTLSFRPEALDWIEWARERAHRVILWTYGTREWFEYLASHFPILLEFDEVYTRDEYPSPIKDVRDYGIDLLIDNDPSHRQWGRMHGIEDRYLTVPTHGEI
jgi:hypothetical protein